MLNEPQDFLGAMIAKMVSRSLSSEDERERVQRWKMSVTISTDFYDFSLIFDNGITVTTSLASNPTLVAETTFDTLLQILNGRTTLLRSFIGRGVRLNGFLRHPISAMRFYRLMNSILGG